MITMSYDFKTFKAETTEVKAFRITAHFVGSCPKMGGGILRHGPGVMLYTGAYKGREKEVQYGQVGDYVVKSGESLAIISKDAFEKELKLVQVDETAPEVTPVKQEETLITNEEKKEEGSNGEPGTSNGVNLSTTPDITAGSSQNVGEQGVQADASSGGNEGGDSGKAGGSANPAVGSPGPDNAGSKHGHRERPKA